MTFCQIISRFSLLFLALAMLAGCASKPVDTRRFFWPPLPDRPRIEWIASYTSQLDFPKTGFQKFIASVAGEEDPIFFNKPLDIKSNGEGKVYITDPGLATVFVYDLVKHDVHMLGRDAAVGLFRQPLGLAIDNSGSVYVSDTEKNMIFVFDANEKPLRSIDTSKDVKRIGGIVIDKKNRLLAVDTKGHKVDIYSTDGTHLSSFGEPGNDDGAFNFPAAITVNSKNEIIVGDTMNARVQIFDENGKFLRKFGSRGDGPSDFQIIKAVTVDSEDHIYVTEGKGHKLIIFDTNGQYLLRVGDQYAALSTGKVAPGGFLIPQGAHIDKNDRLYVVDQLNRRFQVFQYISDGFLQKNPIPGYPAQ